MELSNGRLEKLPKDIIRLFFILILSECISWLDPTMGKFVYERWLFKLRKSLRSVSIYDYKRGTCILTVVHTGNELFPPTKVCWSLCCKIPWIAWDFIQIYHTVFRARKMVWCEYIPTQTYRWFANFHTKALPLPTIRAQSSESQPTPAPCCFPFYRTTMYHFLKIFRITGK